MNKHKKIESDDLINPDFATSIYYGIKPLTENELITELENDHTIYRKFMSRGYIISKEFSFITRSTFDESKVSELDFRYHGAKTPEQKEQAIKMCKVIENYFNSISTGKPMKVAFISRSDSECALYNKNRFDYDKINNKLIEAFM